MKKLLIATTALVATATVAAADTTVKGRATFGAIKMGTAATVLKSSVDLTIVGTTETDSGVKLSASVDLDNFGTSNTYGKSTFNTLQSAAGSTDTVIGVSAGALSFHYGDTDGAVDAATTEAHRISGINFELWGGGFDNDDDGAIARLSYAAGPATIYLSYAGTDDAVGVGVKYSADAGSAKLNLGLGYEDSNTGDVLAVSLGADFGAFGVRVVYADGSDASVNGELDFSVQYAANGLTVGANYLTNDSGQEDYTIFGQYALGGGADLFAQHGERSGSKTTSMGVQFNF